MTAPPHSFPTSPAIEWLPKISGGALNFHVSAAAGGVEDGSLTRGDGLALTGLEDIMVTTDAKPEETVYLRGFIGVDYDGTSWQAGNAAAFDSAAANWKTDGDGRLAIANLPFLRAAYSGAQPQQMTVQRLPRYGSVAVRRVVVVKICVVRRIRVGRYVLLFSAQTGRGAAGGP